MIKGFFIRKTAGIRKAFLRDTSEHLASIEI